MGTTQDKMSYPKRARSNSCPAPSTSLSASSFGFKTNLESLNEQATSSSTGDNKKIKPTDLHYLSELSGLSEKAVVDILKRLCRENTLGYLDKKAFLDLYGAFREEPAEKTRIIAEYAFDVFDTDKNGTLIFFTANPIYSLIYNVFTIFM
jgi:hypothetical protein